MVKWYHKSLPSLRCGFDSRYPLQISPDKISLLIDNLLIKLLKIFPKVSDLEEF